MSHCQDFELLLAEYATGDLAPDETAAVAVHLKGCAACRQELVREKALLGTLSGLPVAECPQRVSDAILAATEPAPTTRWWLGRSQATGLAAAVLALVVLLPLGLNRFSVPTEPTYTAEEIRLARREATTALLLTTRAIDRGERTAARQIEKSLPKTLTRTLKTITELGEGGQG